MSFEYTHNGVGGVPGQFVTLPATPAAGNHQFDTVFNSFERRNVPGGDVEGTTYPSTVPPGFYWSDSRLDGVIAPSSTISSSFVVEAGSSWGWGAWAIPTGTRCMVAESAIQLGETYRDDVNALPVPVISLNATLLNAAGQVAFQSYPVGHFAFTPPAAAAETPHTQDWYFRVVDGQTFAASGQQGIPVTRYGPVTGPRHVQYPAARVSIKWDLDADIATVTLSKLVEGDVIVSQDLVGIGARLASITGGYTIGSFYSVVYGNFASQYSGTREQYRFGLDDLVAKSCVSTPPAPAAPIDYDNAGVPNVDVVNSQNDFGDPTGKFPCPPRYVVQRSAAAPTRLVRLGRAQAYRAAIMARGGRSLVWDIPARAVSAVSWERRANDVGEHSVTISKRVGMMRDLGRIRSWAHEAIIWRIPEHGQPQLCAVGPVTGRLENADTVKISFKDLSAWWGKRVVHHDYAFDGCTDLTDIARWIINDGMGPDDPNFLDHALWFPSGVSATRSGAAFRLMVDKEISDLAGLGLDWTMSGRRLVVSGELAAMWPRVARLSRAHFLTDVEVDEAGAETLTRTFVTGSGTTIGYAGGVDETMGLLETVTGNDSVTDADTARVAARAALAVAYPSPIYVRVPDGAALSPNAPITLEQLLPGIAVFVDIDGYAFRVGQTQRLTRVAGSWERESGEKIAVALAPYAAVPADDGSPVGPPEPVEDVESEPDEPLLDQSFEAAAALPDDGDDVPEGADDTALPTGPEEGDTGSDDGGQSSDGPDTGAPVIPDDPNDEGP